MDDNSLRKIQPEDLETAWNCELSDWLRTRALSVDLRYKILNAHERDNAILETLKVLEGDVEAAGAHRLSVWERGWGQNHDKFTETRDHSALIPGYFGKFPLIRWRQQLIEPISRDMEYQMLGLLLDWVFDNYVPEGQTIYEFGAGTGHNLIRARERHSDVDLWGLDWAESSQSIIRRYANTHDDRLHAHRFDYFNPDTNFKLDSGATVLTVASLEQTGTNYVDFIEYLMNQDVGCVIHIEPISEMLDIMDLLDFLSIKYFKKRNYLNGFLNYLRSKDDASNIEILDLRRTYVGSFLIDGYSLVVWRPLFHKS